MIRFRNRLASITEESRLKCGFIALFVAAYLVSGIGIMVRAFDFILSLPVAGPLLLQRAFYVYFFVLFWMLLISSFILTLTSVFSDRETEHLLLLPVPVENAFFVKFTGICVQANWAFLFLSVPVFTAFGLVKELPPLSYVLSGIMILVPFIWICSVLGFIAAVLWVRFLWNRWGGVLAGGALAAAALKMSLLWSRRELWATNDTALILDRMLQHTSWSINPWFPSTWLSRLFLSLSGIETAEPLLYLRLIVSLCLLLSVLLFMVSARWGHAAWSGYRSRGGRTRRFSLYRIIDPACRGLGTNRDTSALIAKDLLLFFRDPVQFSQFGVFFGLLFLYLLNIKNMLFEANLESAFWKTWIAFLNLGSVCLILATLSTRFMFPQVSLEGKCFWILSLSPLAKKKILLTKYAFSLVVSLAITLFLTVLSNTMLGVENRLFITTLLIAACAGTTLPAISIGLGAIFPNWSGAGSAAIVSGFGGTLTLIVSVLYVSLAAGVPALWEHCRAVGILAPAAARNGLLFTLAVMIVLSASTVYGILQRASVSLDRAEF